jgi:DNA polymerase (family X)
VNLQRRGIYQFERGGGNAHPSLGFVDFLQEPGENFVLGVAPPPVIGDEAAGELNPVVAKGQRDHGIYHDFFNEEIEKIDQFNDNSKGIRVLKAIEVDILEDGTLDLPNEVLQELDVTVCAVHYHRNMSRREMTERIIRAMDNPHFHILGHPTGRLIGKREPYEVDMEKILEAAQKNRCFLELDSQPDRLDLSDVYCKRAKEMGVKIAISTDAHSVAELDYLRFGIGQARRGWLAADDVLNTRTWPQLKKLFHRK